MAFCLSLPVFGCRFDYELIDDLGVNLGGANGSGGTSDDTSTGGATPGVGGEGAGSGGEASGGTGSGGAGSGGAGSGGAGSGGAGSGGAGSGGAGSGGAGSGGAGSGGSSWTFDLEVETPADTSGGALLSLRDAINQSNMTGGTQVISLSGFTVNLGSGLPQVTDSVAIVGEGGAIDGSTGGNSSCLLVNASNVTIDGVEIFGCIQEPLDIQSGSGNVVINSYFHDNDGAVLARGTGIVIENNDFSGHAGTSLGVYSPGSQVRNNRIFDSGNAGIFLDRTSDGVTIVGNLIVRSTGAGIGMGGLAGATILHNTIVSSGGPGVETGQAGGIDFRNNIVSHSGGAAVNGSDGKFTAFDYCLLFQNVGGNCNGCSTLPGGSTISGSDPLYDSFAGDVFTLQLPSPAVDQAQVSSERPTYSGLGPDIGYAESH